MKKCMLVFLMLLVCCANENKPQDGAIRVNGTWIKKDNIDKVVELYRQQMLAAFPRNHLRAFLQRSRRTSHSSSSRTNWYCRKPASARCRATPRGWNRCLKG